MTKCKYILNWNSILDFFKWTHLFLNKIVPIQGSTIKIQLLSARFSLIITTFAISELPQNSTKKKRGTTGYAQQLIIKDLNILRMFG